jgi:predicted MFS family arabinose efflux permease
MPPVRNGGCNRGYDHAEAINNSARGRQDMLFRSWLAFTIVIGVVQVLLGLLAVLQHDAIYSQLLRQRIAVISQTIVASYKPIVDLGLPVSMIRNGDQVVLRARDMDAEIGVANTFNPSGIVVHSTQTPRPPSVSSEVLRRMHLADGTTWGTETETEVISGHTIQRADGEAVAAVTVSYPKDRLSEASSAIFRKMAIAGFLIWLAISAVAFFLLRFLLAGPRRAINGLGAIGKRSEPAEDAPLGKGALELEVSRLNANLAEASRQYDAAIKALGYNDGAVAPVLETSRAPQPPERARSLAGVIALKLAPVAAAAIVVSATILGLLVLRDVNRSIEPELAARANLVGVVVSDNVQRAIEAGAPLDKLVGAENYFGDMLSQLPEVAYVAVATGRIVLEAGERIDPYLAPPRQRKDVRSHPILYDGEEIAYVVIDIDPAFIAKRFRDVFLDMSVVVLVTILLAYEVMVLLTSRSLTASLDRLQRLAALQAGGDFSKTATSGHQAVIAGLMRQLSERSTDVYRRLEQAVSSAGNSVPDASLEGLKRHFGLENGPPAPLRISYFTDIRLALFLFAAADELPLAFLPLYTRASENLWPWLDESVLISLPLAGYLLAILFASPFARGLNQRFGLRTLFLAAGLPMIAAHIGLYFAETAQEIIFWRTLTGIGYAIITLACQDYVIDTATPENRDRLLGTFTLVLFGGVLAGVALGGVLADRLGQQNVFLLSALLIGVSALLSTWLIVPGAGASEDKGERFSFAGILAPLSNSRFAAIVFGIAIPMGVILQAFVSYLAALTLDALGASTADIGRALTLFFLGVIAAGPIGGRLAAVGLPVGPVAVLAGLTSGASLVLFGLWPVSWALVTGLAVSGIGYGLARGAQVSLVMKLAEGELKEAGSVAVLGSLRTLERFGSVMGLVAVAAIAGAFGYVAALGAVAAWALVGAAFAATVLLKRLPA